MMRQFEADKLALLAKNAELDQRKAKETLSKL